MPTDTRQQFKIAGRAPGIPLSIGRKVGKVPGVYGPGTSGNQPGPTQSPTSGLTMVQTTPIDAAPQNTDPNRAGSGGTITRGGVTTVVPGSPAKTPAARVNYSDFLRDNPTSPAATGSLATPAAPAGASGRPSPVPAAPVASPTTARAQQTETANPLTGDTNADAGGTTQSVSPGMAMGYSQRGMSTPQGQDAIPAGGVSSVTKDLRDSMAGTFSNLRGSNKTPLSRRQFADRRAQSPYTAGVKSLFAGLQV